MKNNKKTIWTFFDYIFAYYYTVNIPIKQLNTIIQYYSGSRIMVYIRTEINMYEVLSENEIISNEIKGDYVDAIITELDTDNNCLNLERFSSFKIEEMAVYVMAGEDCGNISELRKGGSIRLFRAKKVNAIFFIDMYEHLATLYLRSKNAREKKELKQLVKSF